MAKRRGVAADFARRGVFAQRGKIDSAASMPDFIAVCVPLILGTFKNPAVSPPARRPERSAWQALNAARQGARAVADAPGALEHLADGRVGFEALEFVVGAQMRVS